MVKSTPPTPGQSFQDSSIFMAAVPPLTVPSVPCSRNHPKHAVHLLGGHKSQDQSSNTSRNPSSPSSSSAAATLISTATSTSTVIQRTEGVPDCASVGSNESAQLKPKMSLCSPVHSKRSLSAGMLKKIISNEVECEVLLRVASAEDVKKKVTPRLPLAGHAGTQRHGQEEGRMRKKKKSEKSKSGSDEQSCESSRKSSTASLAELPFWDSEVIPLLQEMESASYEKVQHLRTLCDSLWACLEGHGLLGRLGGVGGSKKRSTVLRTVFKLLDHKDPLVLLKVAKTIIAVSLFSVLLSLLPFSSNCCDIICAVNICLRSRLLLNCVQYNKLQYRVSEPKIT